MKKKLKTILGIFLGILVVAIIGAYLGFKTIESNLNKLKDLKISNVDISNAADRTYTGSFQAFPIAAEVKVTIKNHKITGIELVKHRTGQGAPAEIIPDKVVETQTLEVDAVTGATYSSKVILKAIENALNNANK
ncbi:MAG: FMN-binding protein [Caldiserica bacterium]|nr:FMN-binding protein [Caldisericota bacterium]